MSNFNCSEVGCPKQFEGGYCSMCGLAEESVVGATDASAQSARTSSGLTASPGSGLFTASAGLSMSGRTGSSSRRGSTRSSARRPLGLGLISVQEIPAIADPAAVVMSPEKALATAQSKVTPVKERFCQGKLPGGADCKNPLNKRDKGHCTQCGTSYDFSPLLPTLQAGELVAGQYEVLGPMAAGGMGWIYLGKDRTLNRWVVLKGLLDQKDQSMAQAAAAERQFLADLKHGNIVGIYNFVKHKDDGYIVMEYVGGKSLKSIRKERGPLPLLEGCAYIHRVLSAFAYLHKQGLVYCDFKIDNVMLENDDIKLIDLGGVRRASDNSGDVWGTVGYSAPEMSTQVPTHLSDIYTIGRSLAVLVTNFGGYQKEYQFSLKDPKDEPIYQANDSFYRFLLKATHIDPNLRFQSAEEMAEQLQGVMYEIFARQLQKPRPFNSQFFGGDALALRETADTSRPDASLIPPLRMDLQDPGAQYIFTNVGAIQPSKQTAALKQALSLYPDSKEVHLALAYNLIQLGQYGEAEEQLAQCEKLDAFDWRVIWYRSVSLLRQGNYKDAVAGFSTCYAELPGELAPKLAIGIGLELQQDKGGAAYFYNIVSQTDPGFASAVFGLARCLLSQGNKSEAVSALGRISQAQSLYAEAQKSLALALLEGKPTVSEFEQAARAIEALALTGRELYQLTSAYLKILLDTLAGGTVSASPAASLLGCNVEEDSVRQGLETALRNLAHLTDDPSQKILLVDRANSVRPLTWF